MANRNQQLFFTRSVANLIRRKVHISSQHQLPVVLMPELDTSSYVIPKVHRLTKMGISISIYNQKLFSLSVGLLVDCTVPSLYKNILRLRFHRSSYYTHTTHARIQKLWDV